MGLFNKKISITNENWEFYQSLDEDEIICFTSVDLTYSDPKDQKGFSDELFIRVRIPNDRIHETVPIPEEQEFQNSKEDELCNILLKEKVDCKEVGRLTYNGQKQYIFESNNYDSFKKCFGLWASSFEKKYSLELNKLEPFEYYKDLLPDKYAWQQIGNRHVIEKLIAGGTNQQKEHYIEHGIFGANENLKRLYEELKNHEIDLIQLENDLLEVGVNSILDLDDITEQTDYFMLIAEEFNCKYDGWNTKIEK
jgi:regulator of RNase E activity RraB